MNFKLTILSWSTNLSATVLHLIMSVARLRGLPDQQLPSTGINQACLPTLLQLQIFWKSILQQSTRGMSLPKGPVLLSPPLCQQLHVHTEIQGPWGQAMKMHLISVFKWWQNHIQRIQLHISVSGGKADTCPFSLWYCQYSMYSHAINQAAKPLQIKTNSLIWACFLVCEWGFYLF